MIEDDSSIPMSFATDLLCRVRQMLKRITILVYAWRLLRKLPALSRYYSHRLAGWAIFPVLGARAPLRGYYETTLDFVTRGSGHYVDLLPPSTEARSTDCDRYEPGLFVAVIPGGRAVYDYGVIVSPDHRLLADVSWQDVPLDRSQPMLHAAMHSMLLPGVDHVRASVAVISSIRPHNYFHWMFDILPRIDILRRAGQIPDYYLVKANLSFQKESLSLLNIPATKIINPKPQSQVRADNLIVPSLPGPIFGATPQSWSCRFLRWAFRQRSIRQTPHRLLYLSRADATERRVINEAEVQERIAPFGFESITLTGMPFADQVELFSQARAVVGPHGAGFSNAVFCEPGTVLIEFMPKGRVIDCFERLARFAGLDYSAVYADDNETGGRSSATNDHVVDTVLLRQLLREKLG
jgi:hypothetical protein